MDEHTVPYHNKLHAADVTQLVHSLLVDIELGLFFPTLSRLALLLSAVVHDMGHDGRNNAFHVNRQDDFALTYNDQSVLENHHIASAFKIMWGDPDAAILAGLVREQVVRMRKEMIDEVLGTDMAYHFDK